ncbi:MAG TPA: hypothetical protein VIG08_11180 [Gemmatimonadales bacterium]|jgi:hypothetical protein
MTRRLSILLALAAWLAPFVLHAQTAADSGVFIIRHANDTVATERFARTETGIEGTLAVRSTAATSQDYSVVLAPDGSVVKMELTTRADADSGRVKGKVVSRARVIFKEDSAAVDEASDRGLRTYLFGTRRGAIPYLNLSFALLEQAVRQARASGPASQVALFNLGGAHSGGGQTIRVNVAKLGSDSVTMDIGTVEFHLRVDSDGRLLGGRIPAQNVVVDRAGGS